MPINTKLEAKTANKENKNITKFLEKLGCKMNQAF